MAELSPKRHKKDTDDQDTFQEVSIPFAFPKESKNNHEKEEFKEVSVHFKVLRYYGQCTISSSQYEKNKAFKFKREREKINLHNYCL